MSIRSKVEQAPFHTLTTVEPVDYIKFMTLKEDTKKLSQLSSSDTRPFSRNNGLGLDHGAGMLAQRIQEWFEMYLLRILKRSKLWSTPQIKQ